MELQVNAIQIPESITFNYEEIRNELESTMKRYETMVYTAEQMKEAKADRASLNRLKKALNDERIRLERVYMKPFSDFKLKITELVALIEKPCGLIDKQVKEYEEQQKEKKREAVEAAFSAAGFPDWLNIDQIFNQSWLNASCTMKTVESDLAAMREMIEKELAALSEMPSFAFEAIEVYKQTLNMTAAINEGKRLLDIQRRKEEAERLAKESAKAAAADLEETAEEISGVHPVDDLEEAKPDAQWIGFKALLTIEQAKALRKFFDDNKIQFQAIM
jgi:hypothetical protein